MKKTTLVLPLVLLASCSGARNAAQPVNVQAAPDFATVVEGRGKAEGSFSWFANALTNSHVVDRMQKGREYTLIAVRDRDLGGLGTTYFQDGLSQEELETVLAFHVLPGRITSADLARETSFETLSGQQLFVSNWGGDVEVYTRGANGTRTSSATIVESDLQFDYGVVHFVDHPLVPATDDMRTILEEAGDFSWFLAAVDVVGGQELLTGDGPFTLFAPTDAAFRNEVGSWFDPTNWDGSPSVKARLLDVLQRHLFPGRIYSNDFATGTMTSVGGGRVDVEFRSRTFNFGGARVTRSDIETRNGIVHVVDRVIGG